MFFLTSKILAFLTKPILWVFAILIYTYIYKKKYLLYLTKLTDYYK